MSNAIEPSSNQEIQIQVEGREKVKQGTVRFDCLSPPAEEEDYSSNSTSNNSSIPKKESSQGDGESEETSDSSSTSDTKYSDLGSRSELNKEPKKSRSKMLTSLGNFRSSRRRAKSRFDQTNVVSQDNGQYPTSIQVSDASPGHYSMTSSRNSESSFDSCENGTGNVNSQLEKLSTTSSLRTKRVLKKNKTMFKPKKPLKEKSVEVSLDPSLGKATYSSILKDSKFPKAEDEPEKLEVMKVCPYHHCSLHGHHHHDSPDRDPPKRFEYLKRRSVNSQGTKRSQLATAVKRSGERRGSKALTVAGCGEDFSIEFYTKTRSEPVFGANQENGDAVLADILYGVRSFQGNLNDNRDAFAEGIDIRERTSWGSCFDAKKMEESCSESAYKDFVASSIKEGGKISTSIEITANLNVELKKAEPSNITKGSVENDFGGVANATCLDSDLLPLDKCITIIGERSHEINLDIELVDGSTHRDSEVSSAGHESNKSRVKKVNRLSMWHMIHRQMVSGLASEAGNEHIKHPDEDKLVYINDPNKLPERKDFGSQTNFSDSDMGIESQDLASQEIEIRKMFAIKLVRKAIEKILLPEVQDDQSIASDVTEHDLSQKNQGEVEIIKDAATKNEQKASAEEGKKSESRAPKRWSYLKKVILLNKFIKELEKVKNYTPKKSQHLPLEPKQEAERVSLRRGLIGEKKNSEEWMLDFALRQVVSELAPMQKRKVALLVKAFETVAPSPSQEEEQIKVAIPRPRNLTPKGFSQPLPADIEEQVSNADPNIGVGIQTEATTRSVCESLEQITADGEDNSRESKFEGSFPSDSIAKGEQGAELDRTKRLKMWHMIYQHVVTNIAEKVGTHLLLVEEVDNEKELASVKASEELSRSVAVKLVQEAVDEILLPDDLSDTQSAASDISSLRQEEEEREDAVEALTLKNPQKSKSWSKLKKLIILKRSIKALEQVRKVNLRRPQEVSDPEGDRVDLRNQMTDERKKAEQWMLDYAVQHIVTTLTPARKRRVAMLVEAFEAVVPLPQV